MLDLAGEVFKDANGWVQYTRRGVCALVVMRQISTLVARRAERKPHTDARYGRTATGCILCRFDDSSVNTIMVQSRRFYARYDNFPAADGHIEIVPKRHAVSFFELTPSEAREAYRLMAQAQRRLQERYKPDGFTIGVNDGHAAGRSIDHLHIHIIPRYRGDVKDPRGGIRQVVPNCDPTAWIAG